MESSKSTLREKEERYRRRKSASYDSTEEEERRQTKRHRERDSSRRETDSDSRRDHKHDRSDKYEDRDRKRRRTRSPEESSRRKEDRHTARNDYKERSYNKEKGTRLSKDKSPDQLSRRNRGPLPSQAASFQAEEGTLVPVEEVEKQKPNFGTTGLLAAASNSVAQIDGSSIVLKYHEPAEARKPSAKDQWKLYVFKGADILETIELSVRSCWLVGKDLAVVDLPAEHPTVSKQHAVIQFRYIEKRNEFGDKLGKVKPYLIDLDSTNGTSLNKAEISPSRYVELKDKDMIQFGHSTREYVLMLSPK